MIGKVTFWNRALRFGYIRSADHARSHHVSYTALPIDPDRGTSGLRVGELVEFDHFPGEHMPQAINVRYNSAPAPASN